MRERRVTFATNGALVEQVPGVTLPDAVNRHDPGGQGRDLVTPAMSPPSIAADPQPGSPPAVGRNYGWSALASAGLIAGANVLVVTGFRLPFLGPAIGFWFLIVHPVYLLYTTSVWRRSSVAERLGYSLIAGLLLLMLAGLGVNTFLPLLGVQRPLDPIPVVLLGDTLTVSLYLFRRRHPAKLAWRTQIETIGPEESRLLVASGLCVALAVLGANRLNNGAGDQVTLVALGGIVVTLLLLLCWLRQVRDGMTSVTLYLLSLALLLMTSLRGWYVTGHDIQGEYLVFQLTETHGHWNISAFHNTYNACLSITILPTELAQIVHVDNPYVYKVFFQLMFALCPVLVYAISRRYWSGRIAVLAAAYFVGFPTFFTDMPFLNRQEIAFLFACVAILSITNTEWSLRRRRLALFAASLGLELSHYSTMYLFLGTLLAAWAAQHASALTPRRWRRPTGAPHANRTPWGVMARTVGIGSILMMAAIAFAWGDLATQTAGSALTDAASAISGFVGHSSSVRSGDVSYSLLSGNAATPQTVLNDYRQETLKARAGSSPSTYVPTSVVARYPTPVKDPTPLPLTGAGHLLSDIGVPVAELNSVVRQAAAKGEQVFAGIGLIAIIVMRRFRRQVGREYFFLCVGSLVMVAILTIFPDLSVDYGVLRAFQEALILIAPVLVAGSLTVFSPLGKVWAPRTAAVVCIGIFVSTTGLLPQILGGYPPQLSLNNSGQYYDIYYTHPQEVAAVGWLAGKPGVLPDGVQAENFSDRFAFTAPSDVTGRQSIADIYPSLVTQSSWVILGYSTVHTGRATAYYDGDLITYLYPIGFLQASKNLVYNNGGAEIYK
jgi:uncharacterized membrane protein